MNIMGSTIEEGQALLRELGMTKINVWCPVHWPRQDCFHQRFKKQLVSAGASNLYGDLVAMLSLQWGRLSKTQKRFVQISNIGHQVKCVCESVEQPRKKYKKEKQAWIDGSLFKITDCSFRRPTFDFQLPHGGYQQGVQEDPVRIRGQFSSSIPQGTMRESWDSSDPDPRRSNMAEAHDARQSCNVQWCNTGKL